MLVPDIEPYTLPSDLPQNLLPWQLRADRAVLLIHDMQQYFVDFFPPDQSPVAELIDNISRVRAAAAAAGMPVIYTAQRGSMSLSERGLLRDLWGPGMNAHPTHTRIVSPLQPGPADLVVTKWRYSAFTRSDLAQNIRALGRDQMLICGVYAHVGCLMTACDAFSLDIQPFIVTDGVADFTEQDHRMAVEYASRRCAVILTAKSTVSCIRNGL